MLHVEQGHPDGEREHGRRPVFDGGAVIERRIGPAGLVRGGAVHDQFLPARRDSGEQEAAGAIGTRRPGADLQRHVGERLAVQAQHLSGERRYPRGSLERRQVLPA